MQKPNFPITPQRLFRLCIKNKSCRWSKSQIMAVVDVHKRTSSNPLLPDLLSGSMVHVSLWCCQESSHFSSDPAALCYGKQCQTAWLLAEQPIAKWIIYFLLENQSHLQFTCLDESSAFKTFLKLFLHWRPKVWNKLIFKFFEKLILCLPWLHLVKTVVKYYCI